MLPCGLLMGGEPGWAILGGGLGFSLAGVLLLLNGAGRHDALDRVGTRLVVGGIAGMVLAALMAVGDVQGLGSAMDAMHSLGLTAALSGSSMRIFAWVTGFDEANRARACRVMEWSNGEDFYLEGDADQEDPAVEHVEL